MQKLLHALNDVDALVFGASYDGNKVSVKTLHKEFYAGGTAELSSERTHDLIGNCRNYKGILPCCDPPYLLKRVRIYLLVRNSIIDFSGTGVQCGHILNEATIWAATGITNSMILRQEYII